MGGDGWPPRPSTHLSTFRSGGEPSLPLGDGSALDSSAAVVAVGLRALRRSAERGHYTNQAEITGKMALRM